MGEQRVVLEHDADAARPGAARSTGAPSTRTVPAVWRRKPAMTRKSVVLPQPDGPSSATTSPTRDVQRHIVERTERAVVMADGLDV